MRRRNSPAPRLRCDVQDQRLYYIFSLMISWMSVSYDIDFTIDILIALSCYTSSELAEPPRLSAHRSDLLPVPCTDASSSSTSVFHYPVPSDDHTTISNFQKCCSGQLQQILLASSTSTPARKSGASPSTAVSITPPVTSTPRDSLTGCRWRASYVLMSTYLAGLSLTKIVTMPPISGSHPKLFRVTA